MRVELVCECVQHWPQPLMSIRLKRQRMEGQTGHAERAALISGLAGLSVVYLGQDTPHCSKNKEQGWTVFIHSRGLKARVFCASA